MFWTEPSTHHSLLLGLRVLVCVYVAETMTNLSDILVLVDYGALQTLTCFAFLSRALV